LLVVRRFFPDFEIIVSRAHYDIGEFNIWARSEVYVTRRITDSDCIFAEYLHLLLAWTFGVYAYLISSRRVGVFPPFPLTKLTYQMYALKICSIGTPYYRI
jgi:hypothetical protein